jgi:hypothetical protein
MWNTVTAAGSGWKIQQTLRDHSLKLGCTIQDLTPCLWGTPCCVSVFRTALLPCPAFDTQCFVRDRYDWLHQALPYSNSPAALRRWVSARRNAMMFKISSLERLVPKAPI